jgi:outer membrane protein assembly factor BamD
MKSIHLKFLILFLLFALTSCKSKKDDDIIIPAQMLYEQGISYLKKEKYSKASEEFGRIFFQHPGNEITPQAELMQAYSMFMDSKYQEAVDVLDTFIQLHPMNVDIGYAYYLKGLSYYMQISTVELDSTSTQAAKDTFEEVIRLFPDTKYAIDAKLKIDLVNDHLAAKEIDVGRFYLYKRNPISAITRFQIVVEKYQTTSHLQEALYRLVEAFCMLGMQDEALKYASVLGHNYPDNDWYKKAYNLVKDLKKKEK